MAGIFWGIFWLSAVLGQLGAYFLLHQSTSSHLPLYIAATAGSAFGLVICSTIKLPKRETKPEGGAGTAKLEEQHEEGISYNIKGAPDEDNRREEGSGNSGLQQKALRFAPFLFFMGFEEAFVNGVWPKIFAPNQDQVHTIPLVFVLWACMEAMGSTVSGVVSDHVGRKPVIAFGVRAVPAKEPPF